jgi:hypothetical protein
MLGMTVRICSSISVVAGLHLLRALAGSFVGLVKAFVLNAIFCTALLGAPPTVKYLFPSGAQRGTTAQISAKGEFSRWPVMAWASTGALQVACGDEKGKLQVAVDSAALPGVHWIRLYDDEGASKPIPFVIGNLSEVVEKTSNDSPAMAETLPSSPVTVNGRLEKRDDVDVYVVELAGGQTLVASLVANESLASPMDGVLQILTENGTVLAQNDDWHGIDPQLVFTAPEVGKYLLRIFAFPAQPDSRIGLAGGEDFLYRLTVTTTPFVDYPWPLAVQQNEPTVVELIGWNTAEPNNRQTIIAAGNPRTMAGDRLAGNLSLLVEPHACPTETEPSAADQPQPLELPVTISGRLAATGDRDVYRFSAKGGETVLFQLDGRRLGSPIDAILEITDEAGKSLVRTDDVKQKRDPELSWKAPADGMYQVAVADLHESSGERYIYRLRATRAQPDFHIKSAEHSFQGAVGKPVEITVEIDRQHGFDQEIAIVAERLPEQIKAEPVISAASGETAKNVKIVLTANAPYSGPLRIVGRGKGEQPIDRQATYQVADDAELGELWITFRAAKPD